MAIERSVQQRDEEETRTLAREIGRRSTAQLEAGLNRVMIESSATGRWILGALVVLNGGGIFAMTSAQEPIVGSGAAAAINCFLAGAVIAVLAALASMASGIGVARSYGEAISQWTQVALTGDVSDQAVDAARQMRRKANLWAGGSIALGLLSLVIFSSGALILSASVNSAVQPLAPVSELREPERAATLPTPAPAAALPVPPSPAPATVPTPTPTAALPKVSKPTPKANPTRPVVRRPDRSIQAPPASTPSTGAPASSAPNPASSSPPPG